MVVGKRVEGAVVEWMMVLLLGAMALDTGALSAYIAWVGVFS